MSEEKKPAKKKRPTAEKRLIQNRKKELRNRVYKSKIRTAKRQLVESTAETRDACLSTYYSCVDRAVKLGILKKNTAARLKSRQTTKSA